MTPTEQKALLDQIAAALLGWPNDGERRTYAPEELPRLAALFRRKPEILDAVRDGRDVPETAYGHISGPPGQTVPETRDAFRLLLLLSEQQRNLVLCWFCGACHRYVGPRDICHCNNDE